MASHTSGMVGATAAAVAVAAAATAAAGGGTVENDPTVVASAVADHIARMRRREASGEEVVSKPGGSPPSGRAAIEDGRLRTGRTRVGTGGRKGRAVLKKVICRSNGNKRLPETECGCRYLMLPFGLGPTRARWKRWRYGVGVTVG